MVESLTILALLLGGSLLARTAGIRGWAVPAIGFVLGVAIQVAATAVLAIAGLSAAAWLGPVVTVLVGVAWWGRCRRAGDAVSLDLAPTTAVAAGVVAAVGLFRTVHLVNATPDSFRYMTTTGLIGAGRLDEASAFLLESRALSVAAMHAPATMQGELYLRSLTPLLALACLGALAWLIETSLRGRVTPAAVTVTVGTVGAIALLGTNNRFVFHGFYINGHLLLAVLFLLIAGVGWLYASEANLNGLEARRLLAWPLIVMPAIVLARPDAGVMAALLILPLIVTARLPDRWKVGMLLALGASVSVWQSFVLYAYSLDTRETPTSVPGLLAVGVIITAAAIVVRQAGTGWLPQRMLGIAEGALWLAVFAAVALDPRILLSSAFATLVNVVWDGGWGSSLILLAAMAVAIALFTVARGRAALRFPLTSFVPLAILLAYLRGAAYREGPGDSLNRMLLHYVPIAILFVVTALASDRVRPLTALRPKKEQPDPQAGAA